jgi:hypothetical protein
MHQFVELKLAQTEMRRIEERKFGNEVKNLTIDELWTRN